jgi:glutamyl-tRNA synthetase
MERVRFAPSPTGYLHVGGARTALFNYLFAKATGGKFLLRIEDTDRERSTDDSTQAIFKGLNWLGLKWDEDVLFQGSRASEHYAEAAQLVRAGSAYPCFCSAEDLEAQRAAQPKDQFRYDGRCARLTEAQVTLRIARNDSFVIRFKVPQDGETAWEDLVHGRIAFPNKDLGGDFVIVRTDGSPIYNLAVVCDDIHMGITTVLRGDDHISNTPKQILLYEALGAAVPKFGHLPMIHGADGKKLSKRHGATAVGDYADFGILPQAMNNFLALLGWAPGNDLELMSMDDMVRLFSVERLSKKAAVFDTKKLEWMNRQHMERLPVEALIAFVREHSPNPVIGKPAVMKEYTDEHIQRVVQLVRSRAKSLTDLLALVALYIDPTQATFDPKAVEKAWADKAKALQIIQQAIDELEVGETFTATKENSQVLRVAITGTLVSPPFSEILAALGKTSVYGRLWHARRTLDSR